MAWQSSTQACSSSVPYLSFLLFLTTMTTANNEIATANSDIQSAVLMYSHFLGKRSGDPKLCRTVSQANEAALPASIVCLSRHLYRNNDQIDTRTVDSAVPHSRRRPWESTSPRRNGDQLVRLSDDKKFA